MPKMTTAILNVYKSIKLTLILYLCVFQCLKLKPTRTVKVMNNKIAKNMEIMPIALLFVISLLLSVLIFINYKIYSTRA